MRRNKNKYKYLVVLLLLILVLFLGIGPAVTQEKAAKTEPNNATKPAYITMNFKDVDLQVFIKFISELTGKNFLIDPNVKGTVTIVSPQKLTVDEVHKVFLSVLEVNGFTVIEAGQVSKIVPTATAKTKATETFFERRLRSPEDKIVTQLVPLKHADAANLSRVLASLVEKTGLLVPYAETNTIIVIDSLSNINRIVKIVTELDVPGEEEIWVTQLRYAKADDLAKKFATLFQERRGATTAAAQQAGLIRADLKVLPDERTNSLVVLAAPHAMARIKLLVDRLDQRQVRPRENIHVYPLQNAVSENLAKVLMEIPGKGTKDEKAKAAPVSKDVQITADKATNTLVIIAEPEEYAILEEIIRRLDEPRTMVYVEALIVEVSATKALQLGVEWRIGDEFDGGFREGSDGGVWFTGSRGDRNIANEILASTPPTLPAGFVAGVIGNGISLGGITFPTIAAFVRAVKTDSDFNILSTPQIMTLDNEEASMEVGQNIPFVTQVDQGTEVTSRAIQNFQYKDVGVTLKVTPHINDEGLIRLKIEESVKAVISQTALQGSVLAPTTTYRTAKTSITVKDGETAVIGGLIETRMDRGTTQTPCLGSIPALGWLFKTANDQDQKTNLLVFLTPRVVRSPEELRQIYGKKKEYMDKEAERAHKVQENQVIRKKAFQDDWFFGSTENEE
ncbi:MAG: type II secretion system secretin GspD [Deltaproteobacteria bacterium]